MALDDKTVKIVLDERDLPTHIYYKYEGVSPAGSHKPNTAVAQAYYNKQEGMKRLTTKRGSRAPLAGSRACLLHVHA
ncbi:MAG: hypothetical protein AB7K36_04065 [Chloroflexota bacterium]